MHVFSSAREPVPPGTGPAVTARYIDALGDTAAAAYTEVLAETAAPWSARTGRPLLLLRTQKPYILIGPRDARMPGLSRALAWARSRSLPVYERIAGGSAVVLDEGCLSFAYIEPCRDMTAIQSNYRRMAAGVARALQNMGVAADFGEAPGSYCPGPYDLMAEGVKIAGVAQALRRGVAYVGGMVLVNQDPGRAIDILEQFYALAGDPRKYSVGSTGSISGLLGRRVTLAEVAGHIEKAYAREAVLQKDTLTEEEFVQARELQVRRRLA